MTHAQDPSYPLYPIANILCSALILLMLATNFVRHSWNIGLTVLCIYLFLENLVDGINSIIWAYNWDVKALVYCDIGESFLRPRLCLG
jgi:hypothetical protein